MTCIVSLSASRNASCSEGEGSGSSHGDALGEETLPPALGHHPLRRGGGGHHEEDGDEAAGEGNHLKKRKNAKINQLENF